MTTTPTMTPDAAQVAAGTRPAAGTRVYLRNEPEPFQIMHRSIADQEANPGRVSVARVGTTFAHSVPLYEVLPAGAVPLTGWQAVELREHDAQDDGCHEYAAHDARTGDYLGEVWVNSRGEWRAFRRGVGGSVDAGRTTIDAEPSRGDALAAVGWLDTLPAGMVKRETVIVLADGTVAQVDAAGHSAGRSLLTLAVLPYDRLTMTDPRPVPGLTGTVAPDNGDGLRMITYGVHAPASTRLTLAPPCGECGEPAGRACTPVCPTCP